MTTIKELKETILEMERTAHEYECDAQEADTKDDADFCEMVAGMYRIAAACCWDKLEHLKAWDGWHRPEKGELPLDGKTVLAIVSGSPTDNITLIGDYQMARYYADDPAGWVIEEWPDWETPIVHCWRRKPEVPEDVKKKIQERWAKFRAGDQK